MSAFVIAEAACSHAGDLGRALKMVDRAASWGCDAIKFQMFQHELVPNVKPEVREFLKRCEWTDSQWETLYKYCGDRIKFLATPFDLPSVDRLCGLGVDTIKIPSGRFTDLEFVRYIQSKEKKVIASTGMMDYDEVRRMRRYCPKFTILHCTSAYPCPINQVNLNVLNSRLFDGLSDHTRSTLVPAIAVAMGAKIIEKHLTLNRAFDGPDQKVSLEPDEFVEMLGNVRIVEQMFGDGNKRIMPAEQDILYRKVISGQEIGNSTSESNRGNRKLSDAPSRISTTGK